MSRRTSPSKRTSTRATAALVAVIVAVTLSACESGPTLEGNNASIGRDADGDLTLIGGPCLSSHLTAVAIVAVDDAGIETPVLRLGIDPPLRAWDVVVPLEPLDLDLPGISVEVLDEERLADALQNTGDDYQVLTETIFLEDGSTDRFLVPFWPGLLPANAAYDYDELIENPASYGCPRGKSKPWRDAFDN